MKKNIVLKISVILLLVSIFFPATSCDKPANQTKREIKRVPEATEFRPVEIQATRRILGQVMYVPIYSSIYHYTDDNLLHLTATLSLRNISQKHSIVFTKIDYYDTNGKLIRSYLNKPFELGRMATKDFVVSENDLSGGTGANFLVEWESSEKVSAPLIEAVMIGVVGTKAFAFTSRGKETDSH